MKKNFLITFCLMLGINSTNGQQLSLNDDLPVNENVKKGVLVNGLTYYIYKTDVAKNAASYYIIQNVGSTLEEENQRGLAHFLEHMAFNGTKNFPGKGILNTLQKHGAVFGKNINAYTSFDETVYNLDNVPTNVDGLIDNCLLILHDWSHYLSLTNNEIDAERGVIKEEWRTGQNGSMRIYEESAPIKYNNAIYATRMPIGDMSVVSNFDYKALKDFYHDWYRTDLQAIVVVGDINVMEIEQKIKNLFSNIPAVANKKERLVAQIPNNVEPLFKLSTDKEVPYTSIRYLIRRPNSLKDEKVSDLKESLLNGMVTSIINTRISELAQNPDATFKGGSVNYSELARLSNAFSITVNPKPNKQAEAFRAVLQEVIRAKKFGFSVGEIERVIAKNKSSYENYLKRINELEHSDIVTMIQENYLENSHMTDRVKEFELAKLIYKEIDSKVLQETLNNLYTDENRTILVTGTAGEDNLSKEKTLTIISSVEKDTDLKAYVDSFVIKDLMSGTKLKAGSIVSKSINKALGSTTFLLSNGVKVHYKFADKNKNEVALKAISFGGKSLVKEEDLPSADYAVSLSGMSGLGDFTSTELNKVLTGKTARAWLSLNDFTEEVYGSSVTKDVESMLQMVNLKFVKPRFDEKVYEIVYTNIQNNLQKRGKDITAIKQDKFVTEVYGDNNPRKRLMNQSYLDALSFDKMQSIYLDRFSDVSDFEFFIVGDVPVEIVTPLLKKYIASIPDINRKETWKDNTIKRTADKIDKDIYVKMETPKSTVNVNFENECPYSLKNEIVAKTFADVLTLRYTASLREEEGGTYGAGVWASISKRPTQKGTLDISFDCDAAKVEKLIPIVYKEIAKIKEGEIKQEDLDKTIANYLKSRKESKEFNSYDMNLLVNYFRNGYNMNDTENYENIVSKLRVKDIKEFAEKLTKGARSYEIVYKPEQ
jgi:zinc protease